MEVSFKGKIWKTGTGYVITIPTQYIKDGHIDVEAEYEILLKEATE